MKKIILIVLFSFIAISSYAQPTKDEITYMQSLWGMQKRDIVKAHMKITSSDSASFWNAYEKYEDSRKDLGSERINTIVDYAQNYSTLTDSKADELIMKMLANNSKFLELLNNTYNQMKGVISPLKAAQFVQLESYLDSVLKIALQDEIPLIGEVDKEKPRKIK